MSEEKRPNIADSLTPHSFYEAGSFLQSKEWADFQVKAGKKRLSFSVQGKEVYGFLYPLPFGLSYLYLPHVDIASDMLKEVMRVATEHKAMFIRLEPFSRVVETSGWKTVPTRTRQPQYTLCVPLKQEDEMLKGMHTKTRYNIGLAERKGVVVKKTKNVDIFWKLLVDTTKRDGFKTHEKTYYEHMLSLPSVEQYIAFVDTTPIASIITIRHNSTVTYLHGASLHEHRSVMAPYALQWQALKDAYENGVAWYDMWGVAPSVEVSSPHAETFHTYTWSTSHSFHGITRFKAGFGGVSVVHPEAIEIPLKPFWYTLYRLRQRLIRF
jgi:lipid II:glycine glycyltransferase (peptidoglycan interpeptide bridge formation enzyme)